MKKYILLFLIVLQYIPLYAQSTYQSIEFIKNEGQWNAPFLFRANTGHSTVFLENGGFTYLIGDPANEIKHHPYTPVPGVPDILKFHAYKVIFEGAKLADEVRGSKEQAHYYNYYLGKDPSRWKSGIHPVQAVDYKNIYAGIDLHVASEKNQMKYDFIVSPGADAENIRLRYEGAEGLSVSNGNLKIKTSVGTVEEMQPYAYQYTGGVKTVVPCRYKLRGDEVSYVFPKGYDEGANLIIDPTVVFATFTGSTFDNWGFTATYDNQGNFYAGGITHDLGVSGSSYPTTPGAIQVVYHNGTTGTGSQYPCDMAITKFNASGTAMIYSTYLGGSDNDQPHSLIVDKNNDLVIAGRTYSSDFPVTATAFDNTYNGGADMVVVKFNSTGTALIGSTYMGGSSDDGVNFNALEQVAGGLKHNYGDDARSEVLVDGSTNVYVAASSFSTNFPVTANAFQSNLSGIQDGVVFKLDSSLSNLIYSTYLGGSDNDAAYVLALDPSQTHLFVAGGTSSSNFPSTPGTLWPSYQGGSADGFIARFLNSGNYALQKETFIGRSDYDQCYGIQVDNNSNVYVMGQTLGGTFPVQPVGVYSNPNSSQFIMKLNFNLDTNVYSTVYGSGDPNTTNISPVAFLVDTCKNVYISGWGGNIGFPFPVGNTVGLPVSANAAQSTTDGNDFYFIVLSTNIQSLLYATYMGQNGGTSEHVDGGTSRFDKSGIVYQAICGGCGGSSAFPTTPGVWSNTNNSQNCNLIALKIAFQLSIVKADAQTGNDTSGCPPLVVSFQNSSTSAVSYIWDFGDGSPTSTAVIPPPHTYSIPGTYTARLIAFNPDACLKTSDTDYITIKVDSNSVNSDFKYTVIDSCGPYNVSFQNTSVYSNTPGSMGFTKFNWSFGDGSNFNGANPGIHNYADTGTYSVTLIMTDTTACNWPDTVTKTVRVMGLPLKAAFNSPDSICLGGGLVFANASFNEQNIQWYFGDGDSSNASSPGHTYLSAGTYVVTLVVTNPDACIKADTSRRIIKIKSLPVADFSYTPAIPVPNEPIQFHNLSTNATHYKWSFGDGSGSNEESPLHMYKKTSGYTVCLEAWNEDLCPDTVCKTVYADIHPAVDVPTGFSPNGDNQNDVLYVRGAGIQKLDFKLFNRWGQLLFETDNLEKGWDGKFNGKLQEMEVYAWVLNAEFIDGTTVSKSGNVTLLR